MIEKVNFKYFIFNKMLSSFFFVEIKRAQPPSLKLSQVKVI